MEQEKQFNEMTAKELGAFCEEMDLTVESKNQRPNKDEYYKTIAEYFGVSVLELLEYKEEKPKETLKVDIKAARKRSLQEMHHVIISDNDVSIKGKPAESVYWVSWGNRDGYFTDKYILDSPWHLRQGAIENLESVLMNESYQDDIGGEIKWRTKPRFNIRILTSLTEKETKDIAQRQRLREESDVE